MSENERVFCDTATTMIAIQGLNEPPKDAKYVGPVWKDGVGLFVWFNNKRVRVIHAAEGLFVSNTRKGAEGWDSAETSTEDTPPVQTRRLNPLQ